MQGVVVPVERARELAPALFRPATRADLAVASVGGYGARYVLDYDGSALLQGSLARLQCAATGLHSLTRPGRFVLAKGMFGARQTGSFEWHPSRSVLVEVLYVAGEVDRWHVREGRRLVAGRRLRVGDGVPLAFKCHAVGERRPAVYVLLLVELHFSPALITEVTLQPSHPT